MQDCFHTMRASGHIVTTTTLDETVHAFVPDPLPPVEPALTPESCGAAVRRAELALARLSGVAGLVPSMDWLLYGAIRKEALLSAQIEGARATLTDLFDAEAGLAVAKPDDVREVANGLRAFSGLRDSLRSPNGQPISVRLLCEAHRLLRAGARGAGQPPGELRRSQNGTGGSRPGRARFVPPPPDRVPALLDDLERFIHEADAGLPPLVRVALVHAQFETIHPFVDGNGRVGRLLTAALLEQWGLLPEPLVVLSGYLEQNQLEYQQRLAAVRTDGDWEGWIAFFMDGVETAATDAECDIVAIASLVAADRRRLLAAPRVGAVALRLFELLPLMPRLTIEQVRQRLATSFPTAAAAVKLLEELGIVTELTGQKKNRCFSYAGYVELLANGT